MSNKRDKVAIIGASCRFPKSRDITTLWNNLTHGQDCVTHFHQSSQDQNHQNSQMITARGILDDIAYFDADYFGISEQDASIMDPQHRLFLTHGVKAVESAGYDPKSLSGKVGVFASAADSTYLHHNLLSNASFRQSHFAYRTHTLTSSGFLATRMAYLLNFTGPCININVACSSSLVGVIYACKALINNDADICLAGGVSIKCPQNSDVLYKSGGILSLDGICRPFDTLAAGTVSSNGIGVIMLKRLSHAIRDDDPILAVISGFAVNNDGGTKVSYSAPSVDKQSECIQSAIMRAGVTTHDIGYVEAHGTATPLGDMIETQALKNVFHACAQNQSCAIGSIKSNIGHTDMASGIAGLIKAALSIYHKTLVPTIHHEVTNPALKLLESPFYVNTTLKPWHLTGTQTKRMAGVNSLGIGGTNAHLILEEYPRRYDTSDIFDRPTALIHEKKYWVSPTQPCYSLPASTNTSTKHFNIAYWELCPIKQCTVQPKERWVVFADRDLRSSALIDRLTSTYQHIAILYREKGNVTPAQNTYQFSSRDAMDYCHAKYFIQNQLNRIDHVVYLWSPVNATNTPLIDLKNSFHETLRGMMDNRTTVSLITQRAISLGENEDTTPTNAMTLGFGLVLAQEFRLVCRSYDVDDTVSGEMLLNCLLMPRNHELYQVLAIRNNMLFTRSIKPWNPHTTQSKKIQSSCHVIIMGGLGHIGLSISRWFAQNHQAHLLLIANKNSYPTAEELIYPLQGCAHLFCDRLRNQLVAIDRQASSLKIAFCDVVDYSNIKNCLKRYTEKNTTIDILFHLCAKIDDNTKHPISDIRKEEIAAQLAPKVDGLKNIKLLTHDFAISKVVVFSSLATLLGGISMATYTSVNAAVDAYISTIRDKKTQWLCLNWEAWPWPRTVNEFDEHNFTISDEFDALKTLALIINQVTENTKQIYVSSQPVCLPLIQQLCEPDRQPEASDHIKPLVRFLFSDCLGEKTLKDDDDFFTLGGDSLSAVEFIDQIEKKLSLSISHEFLYTHRTINAITRALSQKKQLSHKTIFLINRSHGKPLFLFHPLSGMNSCYTTLSQYLEPDYGCYCIEDPEIQSGKIVFEHFDAMVDHYYQQIKTIQNAGEFILVGYSLGGSIAHAITKRLENESICDINLFILDGWASHSHQVKNLHYFQKAAKRHTQKILERVSNKYREETLITLLWHRMQLLFEYQHEIINHDIHLIKADIVLDEYQSIDHPCNHWNRYTQGEVHVHQLPYDHNTLINNNSSFTISKVIRDTVNHNRP